MTAPSRRNSLRATVYVLVAAALVIAFVSVLWAGFGGGDKAGAQLAPQTTSLTATVTQTVATTSTTATTATTTAAAPASVCYAVKLDENVGSNVLSKGISQDTEKGRQQVLAAAKQDPRVLMLFYNASPLGKVSPIATATDIAPIKDGACYTARGVEAYDEWSVLYKVANLAPAKLPATGYNTGVNGEPFQVQGRIPAGTGTEVKYVDSNGKVIDKNLIRNECGNIISEKKIVVIKVIVAEVTVTKTLPTTVISTTQTTSTSLAPKIPGEDPGARGNAGNGGGKNQNTGPGVFQPTTPASPPSTSRVNPTTPTIVVTTPPRVSVTTINSGSSTPTVDPSTQPVNNGWVSPTPTSGAACNPKFFSC